MPANFLQAKRIKPQAASRTKSRRSEDYLSNGYAVKVRLYSLTGLSRAPKHLTMPNLTLPYAYYTASWPSGKGSGLQIHHRGFESHRRLYLASEFD